MSKSWNAKRINVHDLRPLLPLWARVLLGALTTVVALLLLQRLLLSSSPIAGAAVFLAPAVTAAAFGALAELARHRFRRWYPALFATAAALGVYAAGWTPRSAAPPLICGALIAGLTHVFLGRQRVPLRAVDFLAALAALTLLAVILAFITIGLTSRTLGQLRLELAAGLLGGLGMIALDLLAAVGRWAAKET